MPPYGAVAVSEHAVLEPGVALALAEVLNHARLQAIESISTAAAAPSGGPSPARRPGGRAGRRSGDRAGAAAAPCARDARTPERRAGRACTTVVHSPLQTSGSSSRLRARRGRRTAASRQPASSAALGRQVAQRSCAEERLGVAAAARPLCARREVRPPAETRGLRALRLARQQCAVDDQPRAARRARAAGLRTEPARLQRGADVGLAEALRGRRGRGRRARGRPSRGEPDHALSKTPQTRSKRPGAQVGGRDQDLHGAGVGDVAAEFVVGPRVNRCRHASCAGARRAPSSRRPRWARRRSRGAVLRASACRAARSGVRTSAPSRRSSPSRSGAIRTSPSKARSGTSGGRVKRGRRGPQLQHVRPGTARAAAPLPARACTTVVQSPPHSPKSRSPGSNSTWVKNSSVPPSRRSSRAAPGSSRTRICARKVWCLPLHAATRRSRGDPAGRRSATSRARPAPACAGRDRSSRRAGRLRRPWSRRSRSPPRSAPCGPRASRKPSARRRGRRDEQQEQER